MSDIIDPINSYEQITKPHELTKEEKDIFLNLDPDLLSCSTTFGLIEKINENGEIQTTLKSIIDFGDEILGFPDNQDGVTYLVDTIFDGKWVSEDIGRMLIILKFEGYYRGKIDCTAGIGMLQGIKEYIRFENNQNNQNDFQFNYANLNVNYSYLKKEVYEKLIEAGITENEYIIFGRMFVELNDLVKNGETQEAKALLKMYSERHGEKIGVFSDIVVQDSQYGPMIEFLKHPATKSILKSTPIPGGMGLWRKLISGYIQDDSFGMILRNNGKYFTPFVGNYWDFEDGATNISNGEIGSGCLNFASGIVGTGLDLLCLFPPVAIIGQPAKVGAKVGFKTVIQMLKKGESLGKIGKHLAGVLIETAGTMKRTFVKFSDELARMKADPVYQKQMVSKISKEMLDNIDNTMPMIAKFEEYTKSLPSVLSNPMQIFINSIKPLLYSGIEGIRGMTNTLSFKTIGKRSFKNTNTINDSMSVVETGI